MKLKVLAAGVALALVGQSMAATTNPAAPVVSPTLPAATGGTVDVTLTIPHIVHISGLNELAMGTYAGDGVDEGALDNFCVFRNGSGSYELTLTSANATAGSHQMQNQSDATKFIPYAVDFQDTAGTIFDIPSSATALPRVNGAVAVNPVCGGVDNAAIGVSVPAAVLDAAYPGNYLDTITITVSAI